MPPAGGGGSAGDADSDAVNNNSERLVGTSPCDSDSDNDGLNDGGEITAATDQAFYWQLTESDDGVDLTDALNSLMSFGHDCG